MAREAVPPRRKEQAKGDGKGDVDLTSTYSALKKLYKENVRPLEQFYQFENFFTMPLTDKDIEAKPFVLLIGQYSVGKTSFINHLLGDPPKGYPGANVGPEPTTDRFVAITSGSSERIMPGNAAAVNPNMPFTGLQAFGNAFLQKFQVAEMRSPILDHVTLIDTPGVLSGEKQRIGRNYDMSKVCRWFAERSDLVLLLFDAHKLDISDELKEIIECLRGHDDKIRIVLNKSDQVTPRQLLRVYGSLMWSLGKVFKSPEVSRVYISSFWKHPYSEKGSPVHEIFDQEKEDLFRDLLDIPRYAAVRRINEVVKRARTVKVHALVCSTIRKMMPSMWGADKKQREIVENLDVVFTAVSMEHGIPPGDFPDVEVYRCKLNSWLSAGKSLKTMPRLDKGLVDSLDNCLRTHLSELMSILSHAERADKFDRGFLNHSNGSNLLSATPPQSSHAPRAIGWREGGQGGKGGGGGREVDTGGGSSQRSAAREEEVEEIGAQQAGWGQRRDWGEGAGGFSDTPVKVLSGGGGRGGRVSASEGYVMGVTHGQEEAGADMWGGADLLSREKGKRMVACKGYMASGDDELSLDAGEVVIVTEEHPSGWWKGRKISRGGQMMEGLFPSNTVKMS